MKKILLIGKNGQIGWELQRCLAPLGIVVAAGQETCDLTHPERIAAFVRQVKPDMLINAAAYTAVDKAEEDQAAAEAINALAPGILGQEARRLGIPLIHYSTDYVFDGIASTPYREEDPPNPLNVYGKTKRAGELAVMSSGCEFLILRTSWVYGWRGQNFLLSMLRLAAEKEELRVVNDQIGVPNWSRGIAAATAHLAAAWQPGQGGIFHLSCQGAASWYDFASAIFEMAPLPKKPRLVPVSTGEFMRPACRPAYSALNSDKLAHVFALRLPFWKEMLSLAMQT